MAKLKAPLLSLGASGAIGKAIVYFPWKGLNVAREYVIPSNPQTTGQTTQRGYLTEAVQYIHQMQANPAEPLGEADIMAYALWGSTFATPRTWFNQVVKNWIDQRVDTRVGNIFFFGSTVPGVDELAVDGRHGPTVITDGVFRYGTSKTALIRSIVADITPGNQSVTIPNLTTGVKYYWQFVPTAPDSCIGQKSGIYYGVAG